MSLDGRSACDSMSRVAFLSKLREVAPELLLFVRLFYGRPSSYSWWDAGRVGPCRKAKAASRAMLSARSANMKRFVKPRPRCTVRRHGPRTCPEALDSATRAVESYCGIASTFGRARVFALEGGPPPPGIAELGDAVWRG